jgi:hypothetical protein
MCPVSRDPSREEDTICTAIAPDAVIIVRTYGTGSLYSQASSAHICPPKSKNQVVREPPGLSGRRSCRKSGHTRPRLILARNARKVSHCRERLAARPRR